MFLVLSDKSRRTTLATFEGVRGKSYWYLFFYILLLSENL